MHRGRIPDQPRRLSNAFLPNRPARSWLTLSVRDLEVSSAARTPAPQGATVILVVCPACRRFRLASRGPYAVSVARSVDDSRSRYPLENAHSGSRAAEIFAEVADEFARTGRRLPLPPDLDDEELDRAFWTEVDRRQKKLPPGE